jgi:hypothetical protein
LSSGPGTLSSKKNFDDVLMTFLMTIILYYSKSYILFIKIIKIIEVQNFSFHQPVKASLLGKFISGSITNNAELLV